MKHTPKAAVQISDSVRQELYHTMRLIRRFEERVVELVNSNDIAGVTHEYVGQEAVATGICAAPEPTDLIPITQRGHGHVLAKGTGARSAMAGWFGLTTGPTPGRGGAAGG